MPPAITTDRGYCISLPTPVAKSNGRIPNKAVNAVISTGRKRSKVASFTTIFKSTSGNL